MVANDDDCDDNKNVCQAACVYNKLASSKMRKLKSLQAEKLTN